MGIELARLTHVTGALTAAAGLLWLAASLRTGIRRVPALRQAARWHAIGHSGANPGGGRDTVRRGGSALRS